MPYQTGFVASQFIPSVGWTASNLSARTRYAAKAAMGMKAMRRNA